MCRSGARSTPARRAQHARVLAEWDANGRRPTPTSPSDCTVNELILAFLPHADRHYGDSDGTPTNELNDYWLSLRSPREPYGHTPSTDFSPLALKVVRQRMVDSGLSRGVINQRIGRIRRKFKWAVGEELIPPTLYQAL